MGAAHNKQDADGSSAGRGQQMNEPSSHSSHSVKEDIKVSASNHDNGDKNDTCSDSFTPAEIKRIRATWATLEERANDHGVEVFLAIFALRPELKALFPFGDVPDVALQAHSIFRSHAMRFMRAIDLVVKHLDDLEVGATPSLELLGRTHRRIIGFHPEDLWVFHSAMNTVWEKRIGDGYDEQTRAAWQKVFNIITGKMSEGYTTQ